MEQSSKANNFLCVASLRETTPQLNF